MWECLYLLLIKPTCPITVSDQGSIPQNSWIITQKLNLKYWSAISLIFNKEITLTERRKSRKIRHEFMIECKGRLQSADWRNS